MLLNLSYLVSDYLLLMKYLLFCCYLLRSRCDFSGLAVRVACSLGCFLDMSRVLLHFCTSTGHLKVRNQLFVKYLRVSDRTGLLNTALDV